MANRTPRIEFRRALESVHQRLAQGGYPVGRSLPAERQLAAELGISRNTVRRLLHTLVAEHAIDEEHRVLGAPGSAAAVAPAFGPTVLVVDDLVGLDPQRMRQPGWLERILHTTELELRRAGFSVLTVHPRHILELQPHRAGALQGAVLGWGGGPLDLERLALRLRGLGVPIVAVGEEPAMLGFDRVWSDHACGAEAATRWLLERGRRRILPMLPLRTQWQRDRLTGYRRALASAGVPALAPLTLDHADIGDEVSLAFWAGRTAELLAPHLAAGLDAILAINDFEIPLLVHALRRLGREANRDVDLVGYDRVWPEVTGGRFSDIGPLATVDKRNDRMGAAVVELLLGRMRGQLPAGAQQLAVPPLLIELPVAGTGRGPAPAPAP
jgi:DNA-binding LacI/PurR family transcriptional regulator